MVKSRHRLENHPTTNLNYDIHCTLLLDYNKQQFHMKESFPESFLMCGYVCNTCTTVRQGTSYPNKQPHGGPKVLG